MLVNKHEIMSEVSSGALLRLFNSHAACGARPLQNHHHTMLEISLIKRGRGTYTVGRKLYDIKEGDIFIYASDEAHCITEVRAENGVDDMLIMNIHFEPRFIWAPGNGMFDAKYLRVFLDRSADFSNRLERETRATAEISELMMSMEREFEKAEPEYELMVKIQLLTILVLLGRECGFADNSYQMNGSNLHALDDVMEYISENISAPLSLDELAARANMSRSYFSTTFKRLNGVSPWEYIMIKRVETALGLLENTPMSIIEIAIGCGFNNISNFNRAFRKITGKTPTSYRKGGTDAE